MHAFSISGRTGLTYTRTHSFIPIIYQAGALLAGLILADVPNLKAVAVIEPLTCLFGGMYLGSLGMLLSPVCACRRRGIMHASDDRTVGAMGVM